MDELRGMCRLQSLVCATIILLPAPETAHAQTPQRSIVPATLRYTVESRILHETRTLDITLPERYQRDSASRYPVIVALDGEFEGEIAAAIARFYSSVGTLPDVIVVAVHNTSRQRDLTPPALPAFSAPPGPSGGADRFLSFLADEALPFVEGTFRTAPMRVLIGHSLGGLFALHAMAARPDLFTGYVIMEPATWWNNQQPMLQAREALGRPASRRARVMLVNAPSLSRDTASWGGSAPMVRQVRIADETHASMAAAGMAAGLRRLFEDFLPPEWRPGTSPLAMLARYDSLAARVGYEVPIPASSFRMVVQMAIHSRFFDDAERGLDRMERALGASALSRDLRSQLEQERREPAPRNFIPLVVPTRRPTPTAAARFIGRWRSVDEGPAREVEVRASGDTIIVRDLVAFPEGPPFEADDPVIQVTSEGVLEWGLPFFRGLAALLVQKGRLVDDDTLLVEQEARGWVPRDPNFNPRPIRLTRIREGR